MRVGWLWRFALLPLEEMPFCWEGSGAREATAFHCWFLSQLGFNIRGGKASQLGIFISKVRLLFCCSPTRVLSVPWGVAEPAGCTGRPSCLIYISELTAVICHTPSSSRAVLHRFLISSQPTECCCCAVVPQSPSSPVVCGCTGWTGTVGSGLCGRGAAVTAAVTALPFTGDPRLGRTQSWAAGRGPGALGERCGFPGH